MSVWIPRSKDVELEKLRKENHNLKMEIQKLKVDNNKLTGKLETIVKICDKHIIL